RTRKWFVLTIGACGAGRSHSHPAAGERAGCRSVTAANRFRAAKTAPTLTPTQSRNPASGSGLSDARSLQRSYAGSERRRHLDDLVGGNVRPARGFTDRFRIFGFVQAIRLALVGAQEREQPIDTDVAIDLRNRDHGVVVEFDLLGEIAFD